MQSVAAVRKVNRPWIAGVPTDIRVKRIHEPAQTSDGARVLVDRLWPRGLRKDAAALTCWHKNVAPSPELRRWFGHDPARWEVFRAATAPNWQSAQMHLNRCANWPAQVR